MIVSAVAYRPDRRVVYVNGIGFPLGAGDWARLLANVIESRVTSGILFGCNDAAQMFDRRNAGKFEGQPFERIDWAAIIQRPLPHCIPLNAVDNCSARSRGETDHPGVTLFQCA